MRQVNLYIYYHILYYPPKNINYSNNVTIANQMPSDHQAYDYYDVDIRFNMISNDLSNRVEYHDIYYLHAVLVGCQNPKFFRKFKFF